MVKATWLKRSAGTWINWMTSETWEPLAGSIHVTSRTIKHWAFDDNGSFRGIRVQWNFVTKSDNRDRENDYIDSWSGIPALEYGYVVLLVDTVDASKAFRWSWQVEYLFHLRWWSRSLRVFLEIVFSSIAFEHGWCRTKCIVFAIRDSEISRKNETAQGSSR